LKTSSAMSTQTTITFAKFHWNLSTAYKNIA